MSYYYAPSPTSPPFFHLYSLNYLTLWYHWYRFNPFFHKTNMFAFPTSMIPYPVLPWTFWKWLPLYPFCLRILSVTFLYHSNSSFQDFGMRYHLCPCVPFCVNVQMFRFCPPILSKISGTCSALLPFTLFIFFHSDSIFTFGHVRLKVLLSLPLLTPHVAYIIHSSTESIPHLTSRIWLN